MKTDLFDYPLARERIAQRPLPERDGSRLMVLHRQTGAVEHSVFLHLPERLRAGDLLVVNDTRVAPVSFAGRRATGARVGILLLGREPDGSWRALLKSNGKVRAEDRISIQGSDDAFRVLARREGKIRFLHWSGERDVEGTLPLPPYIKREPGDALLTVADCNRYQTVYAAAIGAVAAPTAGLHFTRSMLARLADAGVKIVPITLHVGIGTFAPIECEQIEDHRMHAERYEVSNSAAAAVNEAKREGRRIVAVGTTSARVLEAAWQGDRLAAGAGQTDIYIHPGYEFQVVDALITNFHLPRTSLLVMVAAFGGREAILKAYAEAVEQSYRFFSYGDAMFLV